MKKFSFSRIVSLIATISVLGVSLSSVAAVTLYRGVGLNNPGTGKVGLSPGTFRFNPELSTFDSIASAVAAASAAGIQPSPCYYTLDVIASQVVGASGPVSGLPVGYVALYDGGTAPNIPPGHWSISQPGGMSAASAAAAVSTHAQLNRGRLVNGAHNNPPCN